MARTMLCGCLILAALLTAGCKNTKGSSASSGGSDVWGSPWEGGGGTPATDANLSETDATARMEARIIGLTSEVDRLSRRVAELEGGAPPPANPPRESPIPPRETPKAEPPAPKVPSADEIIARERAAQPKPSTGVLIDVRPLGAESPLSKRYRSWRVVDPDGGVVIGSEQLTDRMRRTQPIFWLASEGATLGPESLPVLGPKPLRTVAVEAALEDAEGVLAAVITVDGDSAKAIRGLPNLREILQAGNIVILLRKTE